MRLWRRVLHATDNLGNTALDNAKRSKNAEMVEAIQVAPAAGGGANDMVGPARHCSPHHELTRNKGYTCVSMTLRVILARCKGCGYSGWGRNRQDVQRFLLPPSSVILMGDPCLLVPSPRRRRQGWARCSQSAGSSPPYCSGDRRCKRLPRISHFWSEAEGHLVLVLRRMGGCPPPRRLTSFMIHCRCRGAATAAAGLVKCVQTCIPCIYSAPGDGLAPQNPFGVDDLFEAR